MALSASSTITVADQTPVSAEATVVVQPPAVAGSTGRGRLVHPTLGTYDYANTPDETVNLDGDVCAPPIWSHAQTLAGGVDTLWPGYMRDVEVVERWMNGEVGSVIAHLRQLWLFLANPPDPAVGSFVEWAPNYATERTYRVALVGLRSGGKEYTLQRRLAGWGYAPQPVELVMRIIGYAD